MKQPPRPRRSRAVPSEEARPLSADAPRSELQSGQGQLPTHQADSAQASSRVEDKTGNEVAARRRGVSATAQHGEVDERAVRRARNRELRRQRREEIACVQSSEILRRPVGQADAVAVLGSSDESSTADLDERRKERQSAHRRLLVTRIATVSGAALAVIVLVWAVFFSSLFALDPAKVSVQGLGEDHATTAEVRTAVETFASTPLTRLSTSKVSEQVKNVRLVREAQVERSWPRGLTIKVRPRQAVLAVKEGTSWSLVDDQGVSLSTASSAPEGMAPAVLPEGDVRERAAGEVAAIWSSMGDDLRSVVTMVTHDGQTVTMALTNSRTLNWGVPTDNDLKAKVAGVLISQRQARTYDVSSPVHPVTS